MAKRKKDYWVIANYLSTFIVALIAVLGFVYSQISSRKTSELLLETAKTLENVDNAMISYINPVIYFSGYDWLRGEKLDCDNPPYGITVRFSNGSNIPIKLHYYNVIFTIGDIKDIPVLHKKLSTTLTKDIFASATLMFSSSIREKIKNKRFGDESPPIKIEFQGTISNLNESIVYDVQLFNSVEYDCSVKGVYNFTNNNEIYKLKSKK